ncbi:hypothetical protein KM043_009083 [Ampulex compressa]|nr:hypothetical protein KM043_009083 [Ampulex compressa]
MSAVTENPSSPFGWELINDLGALPPNEDKIVDYLLERLQRGQIYTWVGSLLLVLNPCNEIATNDLYNSSQLDKYINPTDALRKEIIPHIFAIAAKAHYKLVHKLGRPYQVIVISGETGTGKTFNASKTLQFLNVVNKNAVRPQGDSINDIVQKIRHACSVISAFTTASTEQNEVSSRHGQLVQLQYKDGAICGATINSFLLERSRVTRGSNNFQIFYQLIYGLSDMDLKDLMLCRNKDYGVLSMVNRFKKQYYLENFSETSSIMQALGFQARERKDIYLVLALLIHMGDIQFIQEDENCRIDLSTERSREAFKSTCTLSCLSEEDIVELLTTTLIDPKSRWRRHTTYRRKLMTEDECHKRLNSIIRYLYDLLFRWLLNCMNKTLSADYQCTEWLGILDIFGFEFFDTNGMEQLCINYSNEKLQQFFMENYLESGQRDLQEEGFLESKESFDIINVYKRRVCVLEGALLTTLNDAAQSPMIFDMQTVIHNVCSNPDNKKQKFIRERDQQFIIRHYAGSVSYCVKDLISKNTDKVPTEIYIMFAGSGNTFLCSLMSIEDMTIDIAKSNTKKYTMLAKVKQNIDTLLKQLSNCDVHYVRCTRPRRLNECNWDKKDFKKQLAYTGVIDALPLARCKYPIRFSYEDFWNRYGRRCTDVNNLSKKDRCKILLNLLLSSEERDTLIYYGKSLLFMMDSAFYKLEISRREYRKECIDKIQTFWINNRWKIRLDHLNHSNIIAQNKQQTVNKNINNIPEITYTFCSSPEDDDVFITFDKKNDRVANSYTLYTELNNFKGDGDLTKNGYDHFVYYNKERSLYTIRCDSFMFFYKNRILSRRDLAIGSIKFHTRLTCLANSHIIPYYERPHGLVDCL